MNDQEDKPIQAASTPTSTVSEKTSISEDTEQVCPANLISEELQLALNKEATESELNAAINHCKEIILESPEYSLERKWLVRHLIELRLRLQETKEAMTDPQHPRNKTSSVSNRTIQGHHLKLQPLLKNAGHRYCDHCTGTIWSVVQAWYMCEDCGYSCHYKCMASIVRECAHVVACEKGQYELRICPEEGLSTQKYLCAECKAPLVINKEWSDVRKCDYNGLYYCSACHWNSSAIIPARVVHNWDLEPKQVSQASLQILRVTAERPLINLEQLNPKLFSRIHELIVVKRLRQELQGIRKYLLVCRDAIDKHLLWKCDKPHLLENEDQYSLQDLMDAHSGELGTKLQDLMDIYVKHVKEECEICRGRGHICEICRNEEILFPFLDGAYNCSECKAVLHKKCMERKKSGCPRCVRIKKRAEGKREFNNNGVTEIVNDETNLPLKSIN